MDKLQWITRKIVDRALLVKKCNAARAAGKKIVFTNGCFDILHRGHLEQLVQAAGFGDFLVLGLNSDGSVKRLKGPERPVNTAEDRAFQLASLLCVDAVCVFEEDTPELLIRTINPDVLVKGGDYTVDRIAGAEFVLENGGSVELIPFVTGYSTSSLIEKIRKS